MKIFAIGAVLITLPAIIVALYALFTGSPMMLMAALVSLVLNTLPFVGAMFLLRGDKDTTDLSH
jgi:ABC-type bacteriocin/lantibiotic exporter with double-glycine peptidase domain